MRMKAGGDLPREDLLREGVRDYLDALYALNRFRSEVVDLANKVWNARVSELACSMKVQEPPSTNTSGHCNPGRWDKSWDGNWAWLAACTWFPEPLSANCYMGLSFSRDNVEQRGMPHVTFAYDGLKADRPQVIRNCLQDHPHFYEEPGGEIGFAWKLEDVTMVEAEFERAMKHAVEAWSRFGGWRSGPGQA